MSNFNFDYILNIDLSLYPDFMTMDDFFKTATYVLDSSGELQSMNLNINQDFIISLLSYDYYKGRQKGIITYDLANVLVYTNPDYKTLSDVPSKFGYRMLEIIATKIFGNAQDNVLVENGINFYKTGENSLISQIVTDMDKDFDNTNVLNDIFNIYKQSNSYENQPGEHNFSFYNSIWEFPIFYTDNLVFIDGSGTSNFDGPNTGGNEIDNGRYNIPILLRFYGIGSNLPTNVTASGYDLNVNINWIVPITDLIITGYIVKWTGGGTGSKTFLLNQLTIDDNNCSVIFEMEPLLNLTFTVSALFGNIIGPPSLKSNVISTVGPPAVISDLTSISGYTKAYLSWTPPNNNGLTIVSYKYYLNREIISVIPDSINGLSLWFDASDLSTITSSNNIVTNWTNKINSNLSASTGNGIVRSSLYPINNLNTIRFNNSSTLNIPTFIGNTSNVTLFCVINGNVPLNNPSGGYYFIYPEIGQHNVFIYYENSNYYLGYDRNTGPGEINYLIGNTNETTFQVPTLISIQFGGNSTSLPNGLWINGVNHPIVLKNTGGLLIRTYNNLTIGSTRSDSLSYDLGELIMYTTSLTQNQRQNIEGYLSWKWGLQNNLPNNHPFTPNDNKIPTSVDPSVYIDLWLDASNNSTINLNESPIKWTDKKQSIIFSGSSSPPIYENNAFTFNNSINNLYFTFPNTVLNDSSAYCISFVASFGNLGQFLLIKLNAFTSRFFISIGALNSNIINDGRIYIFANGIITNSETILKTNKLYLITIYYNGTHLDIRINGIEDSSTVGNFNIPNDITAPSSFLGCGIQSYNACNTNWSINEFIYCNSLLSLIEVETIEAYLNSKWNLQLNLSNQIIINSDNTYDYDGIIDLNDFSFLNLLETNTFVKDISDNLASSISNLYINSTYSINLSAVNSFGQGILSNTVSVTTGIKFNYPTNLNGESGINKVYLSWTPPLAYESIISFNIYGPTILNIPLNAVYIYDSNIDLLDPTFLSLLDNNIIIVDIDGNYASSFPNLIPGETYTFQVSAINILETNKSNLVSIVINGQPSAPLNLLISIFNNIVTLKWQAPENTGASPIVSYTIELGIISQTLNLNQLEYENDYYSTTITNLQYGILYTVNVKANNESNIIGLPISDTFECIFVPPNPPINLSIINTTNTSIYLRWQDSKYPQNYNGIYSSYNLTLDPSDASGNLEINNGNYFHFNNLIPNTNYIISISTVDTSNNISIPSTITAFTGIKYANNFNLLNQPNDEYLFIFSPGGLDNSLLTDYYLTIFDTNNVNIFNITFGVSFNNGVYDLSNNVWKILINEPLLALSEYTFNLQVFPNTFQSNVDINREVNISLKVPSDLFYNFTIDISNNNTLLSWGPNDISGNVNNYSLTLLDDNDTIIVDNITITDMYYSIIDLSSNINYTGILITDSVNNGIYISIFSFYNYVITDLSNNYIQPITQEVDDYGFWEFTWNKPNDYNDDSLITQSLEILLPTIFYQDQFTNTITRVNIYDLFNNYGYNIEPKYLVISGKWLSSTNVKINSSTSLLFNFNLIPNPPINVHISNSNYSSLSISWEEPKLPQARTENYSYTNYSLSISDNTNTSNIIIPFNDVTSYTFYDLLYLKNYTITISTLDINNVNSSIISLNHFTGNKVAFNIYLLNQPFNLHLFTFTPGIIDILEETDYCLTIFDLNNTIFGNYIFGASGNGVYNSDLNTWSCLILNLIPGKLYTFNLTVFPNGKNNIFDPLRETNITIKVPTNNYYIFNLNISASNMLLNWVQPFVSTSIGDSSIYDERLIIGNIDNVSITYEYNISTLLRNTFYNGSLTTKLNIGNIYTSNIQFYTYLITNLSVVFIPPNTVEPTDLGILRISWVLPSIYNDDTLINLALSINKNNIMLFNKDCTINQIDIAINNLYTNFNYIINNTYNYKIIGRWLNDSGINITSEQTTNFRLPIIDPILEVESITSNSIAVKWKFYNPADISQYQMTINNNGYVAYPPSTSFIFTNLVPSTSYNIQIYSLDLSNNINSNYVSLNSQTSIIEPILLLSAKNYSGSGSWNNEIGNNFNALLGSGSISKNVDNNGIILDGSTYWIIPNLSLGNSWTFNVWYKDTGSINENRNGCIITQKNYSDNKKNIFMLVTSQITIGFDGTNDINPSTNVQFTENVWNNYQVVWNGSNFIVYVNGILYSTTEYNCTSVDGGTEYFIGKNWEDNGWSNFVIGEIGEVRIYNNAISSNQVASDYNNSKLIFQ
jgi:hypothetical protein